MIAPNKNEFLIEFGLEPSFENLEMGVVQYSVKSANKAYELLFSFGYAYKSFQVVINVHSIKTVVFSTECVEKIYIDYDHSINSKVIKIGGAYNGASFEGGIVMSDQPYFEWAALQV